MAHIRGKYEEDLKNLSKMIIEMVNESREALNNAIISLKEQNLELAQQIIEHDPTINKLETEIHEKAVTMIATQQPVASDLRKIMVATKIASEIERISDLAVNIAKSVKLIGKEPLIKPIEHLPEMAALTQGMLTDIVDAFHNLNADEAFEIAKRDDQVDKMHKQILNELNEIAFQKPKAIDQITQLQFITRNIERAGDHVTNIAENIIYLIKGERMDLNL